MLVKTDDTQYLKARYINEERNIELGIYPVLFGWRVHAGIIDSGFYELDYCCGANQEFVEYLLAVIKSILEKNDYNWKVFPCQERKPVFNDVACFVKLVELAGEVDKIPVPNLTILRHEIMQTVYEK